MGSVRGRRRKVVETVYFVAAKKYFLINANSRVAYEQTNMNDTTQLIRPRPTYIS